MPKWETCVLKWARIVLKVCHLILKTVTRKYAARTHTYYVFKHTCKPKVSAVFKQGAMKAYRGRAGEAPLKPVRMQVLTATSMKMTVLSHVVPFSLVETDRRFRGAYCLHRQGDDHPNYEGSKHLWNVGEFVPDYMAQHPIAESSSVVFLYAFPY
jgi:hypothetical protein